MAVTADIVEAAQLELIRLPVDHEIVDALQRGQVAVIGVFVRAAGVGGAVEAEGEALRQQPDRGIGEVEPEVERQPGQFGAVEGRADSWKAASTDPPIYYKRILSDGNVTSV